MSRQGNATFPEALRLNTTIMLVDLSPGPGGRRRATFGVEKELMNRIGSGQHLGERDRQEDALAVIRPTDSAPDSDLLLLLADAMGGHAGGEIASTLSIDTFADHFKNISDNMRPRGRLREALDAENIAIGARVAQDPALSGMGCTFIGALVAEGRLVWISVGDSLLYMLRNGRIRRLNADHSLLGELMQMVDRQEMSLADARSRPRRNALRSALTGQDIALVDLNTIALEPGDIILPASDGLDTLDDTQIAEILQAQAKSDAETCADALLKAVERHPRPRQDNTSVIVLRQTDTTSSAGFLAARRAGGMVRLPMPILAGLVGAVLAALAAFVLVRGPAPPPATPTPDATPIPPDDGAAWGI